MKWARFCYTQKAKHLSQQQVKNFALSDSPRRSALPYGGIFDTQSEKRKMKMMWMDTIIEQSESVSRSSSSQER